MNNLVYVLGAVLLCSSCIASEYKKSGWYSLGKLAGTILMIVAFVIK